jgi:Helix-turn-helix domain
MSEGWAALPNWIARSETLTIYAKMVLLVISSHVERHGYRLSRQTIAREAGCSVATVKRSVKELVDAGLLDSEATHGANGQGSNLYHIRFTLKEGSDRAGARVNETRTPGLTDPPVEEPLKKNQSRARVRATQAPDEFTIDAPMARWWYGKGRSDIDLERETENFLDHHRAKGTTFKDWTAAWRNWMTNAITYADRSGRRPPPRREVRNPI